MDGKLSNMITNSSSGKDGTKSQCDAGGKAECWQTGFKIEQAQEMHFAQEIRAYVTGVMECYIECYKGVMSKRVG
jgi:hypothetical protein